MTTVKDIKTQVEKLNQYTQSNEFVHVFGWRVDTKGEYSAVRFGKKTPQDNDPIVWVHNGTIIQGMRNPYDPMTPPTEAAEQVTIWTKPLQEENKEKPNPKETLTEVMAGLFTIIIIMWFLAVWLVYIVK